MTILKSILLLFLTASAIAQTNSPNTSSKANRDKLHLVLVDYQGDSEIYRFTWLRTFHKPIAIRIQKAKYA
jgi:hypothetical protein